ncbi:hypothetical protein SLE2022_278720 [Rubroshorea leprosula]
MVIHDALYQVLKEHELLWQAISARNFQQKLQAIHNSIEPQKGTGKDASSLPSSFISTSMYGPIHLLTEPLCFYLLLDPPQPYWENENISELLKSSASHLSSGIF